MGDGDFDFLATICTLTEYIAREKRGKTRAEQTKVGTTPHQPVFNILQHRQIMSVNIVCCLYLIRNVISDKADHRNQILE